MWVEQPQRLLTSATVVLCTCAIPLFATVAHADEPAAAAAPTHAAPNSAEPTAADRATARTLAQQGYEALRDKNYTDAVDRYTRALAIVHAPTLLRDLARAEVGLGKLVDAHENYSIILREGVAAD